MSQAPYAWPVTSAQAPERPSPRGARAAPYAWEEAAALATPTKGNERPATGAQLLSPEWPSAKASADYASPAGKTTGEARGATAFDTSGETWYGDRESGKWKKHVPDGPGGSSSFGHGSNMTVGPERPMVLREEGTAGVSTSEQPQAMLANPGGGAGGKRHVRGAPLEPGAAGVDSTVQPRGHSGPEAAVDRGRKHLEGPSAMPGAAGQGSRGEGRQAGLRADATHSGSKRAGLWWQQ